MQTRFFVSSKGQNHGPWTLEEIAKRLAQAELTAADLLYDPSKEKWIPFVESKQLLDLVRTETIQKPAPPAPEAPVLDSNSSQDRDAQEWYVRRAAKVIGPFSYLGLLRALQEKSVFEFDLIHKGPPNKTGAWLRIAEQPEFQADKIRDLLHEQDLAPKIFLQRRFVRQPISQDALVHDNAKAWIGKTIEVSEGGCGMIVRNALLLPGQVVQIHFGRTEGLNPFNAVCEVVRKRFVREIKDSRTPVEYGFKFLQVDPRAVTAVREYFARKTA